MSVLTISAPFLETRRRSGGRTARSRPFIRWGANGRGSLDGEIQQLERRLLVGKLPRVLMILRNQAQLTPPSGEFPAAPIDTTTTSSALPASFSRIAFAPRSHRTDSSACSWRAPHRSRPPSRTFTSGPIARLHGHNHLHPQSSKLMLWPNGTAFAAMTGSLCHSHSPPRSPGAQGSRQGMPGAGRAAGLRPAQLLAIGFHRRKHLLAWVGAQRDERVRVMRTEAIRSENSRASTFSMKCATADLRCVADFGGSFHLLGSTLHFRQGREPPRSDQMLFSS